MTTFKQAQQTYDNMSPPEDAPNMELYEEEAYEAILSDSDFLAEILTELIQTTNAQVEGKLSTVLTVFAKYVEPTQKQVPYTLGMPAPADLTLLAAGRSFAELLQVAITEASGKLAVELYEEGHE